MPPRSIKHGYSSLHLLHVASRLLGLFVVTNRRVAPVLPDESASHSVSAARLGTTDKSLTLWQDR